MITINKEKFTGIIYKSTGSWYVLKTEFGTFLNARIRGKFKIQNIRTTNPLAVGDNIEYEDEGNNEAWITKIFPRKNYLIRRSVNLSKETHIIASNLDLAGIIFTLKSPETSLGFLDRFLINCEAYQIKPLIILNKWDLFSELEKEYANSILDIYEKIGYETIRVSALNKIYLNDLLNKFQDKRVLLFGHSGAGKTTLINTLIPDLNLQTKEISTFNHKGKHSTTFAQIYDLQNNGSIIDSPGIKEFGIVDFGVYELQSYFPEIFKLSQHCKFNNCKHTIEPKCTIVSAVDNNEISVERYNSYVSLLEECTD